MSGLRVQCVTRRAFWLAIAICLVFLTPTAAFSESKTFLGGYMGEPGDPLHPKIWSNEFHWSPRGLPQPGDAVDFNCTDSILDIPGGATVSSLYTPVTVDTEVKLSGTETLTVTECIRLSNYTSLQLNRGLTISCPLILGDGVQMGEWFGHDFLKEANLTFAGPVQCSGTVYQVGSEFITTFTGNNQFNGTYVLERGTLWLRSGDNFSGTGVIRIGAVGAMGLDENEDMGGVFGGGDVDLYGKTLTYVGSDSGQFTGVIHDGGTLVRGGTGRLELTGVVDAATTLSVTSGCLAIPAGTMSGRTIANSGELEVMVDSTQTLSGIVTGTGVFTKSGLGNLRVSAGKIASTGNLNVLQGALTATGADIVPADSSITVASGTAGR